MNEDVSFLCRIPSIELVKRFQLVFSSFLIKKNKEIKEFLKPFFGCWSKSRRKWQINKFNEQVDSSNKTLRVVFLQCVYPLQKVFSGNHRILMYISYTDHTLPVLLARTQNIYVECLDHTEVFVSLSFSIEHHMVKHQCIFVMQIKNKHIYLCYSTISHKYYQFFVSLSQFSIFILHPKSSVSSLEKMHSLV